MMISLIFSCTSRNLPDSLQDEKVVNNTTWSYMGGAGISDYPVWDSSLVIYESTPYLAYIDEDSHYSISVKKFNGTEWTLLGEKGFAQMTRSPYVYPVRLAVDKGVPYVAFSDDKKDGRISVMSFDGEKWNYVGGTASQTGVSSSYSLYIFNDVLYVIYALASPWDGGPSDISISKLDINQGGQWEYLGSPKFTSAKVGTMGLSYYQNNLYLIYSDFDYTVTNEASHFKTVFQKYNGSVWETLAAIDGTSSGNSCFQPAFNTVYQDTPFLITPICQGSESSEKDYFLLKWTSGQWEKVGNKKIHPDNYVTRSSFDLFIDNNNYYLSYSFKEINNTVIKDSFVAYNGSQWSYVGNKMKVFDGSIQSFFVYKNVPVVAFRDAYQGGKLSVMIEGKSFIDTFRRLTPPVFSLKSGLYQNTQTLTLTAEEGTVIRYTTDGTFPTRQNGVVYQEPVIVKNTMKVRAFAMKADWGDSDIAEANYTIADTLASPVFTPKTGSFADTQSVVLSVSEPGVFIRYTTDGSAPSCTGGILYSSPVQVSSTSLISAIACKSETVRSEVSSASYTILQSVSAPYFTPVPGNYNNPLQISLSTLTDGAMIYYTLNGTAPSRENGNLYTGHFTLSSTSQVKAVTFKGEKYSETVSGAYVIAGTTPVPVIGLAGGHYDSPQTVSITAENGAEIRYTIDGSEPGINIGNIYTAPVLVSKSLTLKAAAFLNGKKSDTVSAVYSFDLPKLGKPVVSPDGGNFADPQTVSLSASGGAKIYSTIDGSTPSASNGSLYTSPFLVNKSQTVKAIAIQSGYQDSDIAEAYFSIGGTLDNPVFSVSGGVYYTSFQLKLTTRTQAVIRYTTDGSDPSKTHGEIYLFPFSVSASVTVKAIAVRDGWTDSQIAASTYTVTGKLSSPSLLPESGNFTTPQMVMISCPDEGASVRYTIDGSIPSLSNGKAYFSPFTLGKSTEVRASCFKENWQASDPVQAVYQIEGTITPPVFSLEEGVYESVKTLSLSSASSGIVIRYTIDGSIPSASSGSVYTSPITISKGTTVKAVSYKEGYGESLVVSKTYRLKLPLPVIDTAGGVYIDSKTIHLSNLSAPSGAVLKYKICKGNSFLCTWESLPETVYSGSIPVQNSLYPSKEEITTVQAGSYKEGWETSDSVSAVYTVTGKTALPSFDLSAGIYSSSKILHLSSQTENSAFQYQKCLYYEGSPACDWNTIPFETYSGYIEIFNPTADLKTAYYTFRSKALKTGWQDSDTREITYTLTGKVKTPVITPDAGTYRTPQTLSISSQTEGAVIRYTTDGSMPSCQTGTVYQGSISDIKTNTVKAIACKENWEASTISSSSFILNYGKLKIKASHPGSDSMGQPYTNVFNLELWAQSLETGERIPAAIRYTTDGSEPSCTAGLLYQSPVSISRNMRFKAIACLDYWSQSDPLSSQYDFKPLKPEFTDPYPGLFLLKTSSYITQGQMTVRITNSNQDTQIRYTTDGNIPNCQTGSLYSEGVSFSRSTTVQAIVCREGWNPSDLSSAVFQLKVDAPQISVSTGGYADPQQVSLYSATNEAVIRYTVNESVPLGNGGVYTIPLTVSQLSNHLQTVAFKEGCIPSDPVSAHYSIGLIAFIDSSGKLSTMFPDGSGVKVLSDDNLASNNYLGIARQPNWSPDGNWIAYFGSGSNGSGLYIIDYNGNNRQIIYNTDSGLDTPVWDSRDNQTLVFARPTGLRTRSIDDFSYSLSNVNITTGTLKDSVIQNDIDTISPGFFWEFYQAFLFLYRNFFDTTGGRIAWVSRNLTTPATTVNKFLTPINLKVNAFKTKPVYPELIYSAFNSTTSSYEIRGIYNLHAMIPVGDSLVDLVDFKLANLSCPAKEFSFHPNFRNNDSLVVFECNREIYTLKFFSGGMIDIHWSDMTGISNLTKIGTGMQPRWSPQGDKIIFTRFEDGIYLMDSNGENVIKINDGGYSPMFRGTTW